MIDPVEVLRRYSATAALERLAGEEGWALMAHSAGGGEAFDLAIASAVSTLLEAGLLERQDVVKGDSGPWFRPTAAGEILVAAYPALKRIKTETEH